MNPALHAGRWLLFPLFALIAACGGGDSESTIPAPTIGSFSATPATTNAGRSATLNWSVSGADALTLNPGAIDVTGLSSFPVSPALSTSYTLQATNAGGTNSASTAVRIYDWAPLGTRLDGFLTTNSSATGLVTGYSFVLFDHVGGLYARSGGDQTAASVLLLASATKLPTVEAILTLVDEGRLDLDQPIGLYLALDPTFSWPADKLTITMRMLLAHTAGIVGLNDGQPLCLSNPGTTLRACAQIIANTSLIATPGSSFNYGGADFQLAGYVATLLSGQTWANFFAARIGTPLGLTSFTYGNPATVTNPRLAGGAQSDVGDYAKIMGLIFNNGFYNGQRVLSQAMVDEIERNQIAGLAVAYTPIPGGRASDYPGYGLGVFLSAAAVHLGSPGPEFSDPGAFGTTPWIDTGLGYGAVLLIGKDTATGFNIWDAVRPLIITQLTTG